MAGDFWARHALLAGLVASVIIVMISVAVIDAVLERRRRERWSVLAQFVMLELVRNARLIWTGVLAQVGLLTADAARPEFVEANGRIVQDTPRLSAAVLDTIADEHRRRELHEEIARLAAHTDEVLGRWAAVMLNADVYAEVIDHHVELATDIGWLISLLDTADPPLDHGRERRASSSPSVQIAGQVTGDDLGSRIVVITQLAEQLDRNTLDLALASRSGCVVASTPRRGELTHGARKSGSSPARCAATPRRKSSWRSAAFMSSIDRSYASPRPPAASMSTARFIAANDTGEVCRANRRAWASAPSSTSSGSAVCCAQPSRAAVGTVEHVGGRQQLERVRHADLPGEQPRHPVLGGKAQPRERGRDPRVGGDPADVRVGGEHEPGAGAGALDRGDHGRADGERVAVVVPELRRASPRGTAAAAARVALVGATRRTDAGELLGVGADAEVAAGAGQHDHSYRGDPSCAWWSAHRYSTAMVAPHALRRSGQSSVIVATPASTS